MTLYEEYENGLNVVLYAIKAYNNLKMAVYMTALAGDTFDERDIEVIWEAITYNGSIDFITDENGARELVRNSFKMYGDFIDPRLLAMIRDYESMSISDFLRLYLEKHEFKLEDDRIIKDFVLDDSEFLDCASVTGVRRKNNEDFACCLSSLVNPNIKLLMVCDGMGGFNHGEKASLIMVKEFIKWFENYDFSLGFSDVLPDINNVISRVRAILHKNYLMTGTTLTFAIIGENETFIGNVGDSRMYIINDGVLTQITEDDSEVWDEFYGHGGPYKKDDLRFLPGGNVLTNAIDDNIYRSVSLKTNIILNSSYDGLLLTSDGVTDVLSDEKIASIIRESYEKNVLDRILFETCLGEPDFPPTYYEDFLYPTLPGKDNASLAVYLKK